VFKNFGLGALVSLLAACSALQSRHPAPGPPPPPGLEVPLPGKSYTIDASRSELRILVYRAGPLARFGHNHVLVNRAVRGAVSVAERGVARLSLEVPVAAFAVDEPAARQEEGADFGGEIPEDAKSGTLHNMLSAALLDAVEFPVIGVDANAAGAPASGTRQLVATVAFRVAGHDSTIDVPFVLDGDSHSLSATGSLELRQSALGLTPYSLMLGALQVQDAITIKFRLVAS
jgi:YceI-like domain